MGSATLALSAALVMVGCSSADSASPTVSPDEADSLVIRDAWVQSADQGMSAAYGVIANETADDVTLVAASSAASEDVELHITVESESGEMVMREAEDGFTILAGAELVLEPGGNHLMLMGLNDPVEPGESVEFAVELSDGSTLEFVASARDYVASGEEYEESPEAESGDSGHGMNADSEEQ